MAKSKPVERELMPEKTEAILSGAMQEFLEHGYAGARIDRIVEAAGVSKATVYRHFPDKQALFTALIEQLACRKNLFQLQLPLEGKDPRDFLRQYARDMLDNVASDPQILVFFRMIIGESGRFPELARAFVAGIEKPSLDLLTTFLATHPTLKVADPEVAARTFNGTLIHFVMLRYVLQSEDLLPMDSDRLLTSLLALILPPEAQP